MIYSDGRPDHRLTYHSVHLSLILVFVNLDLNLSIAAQTAPGHSWTNPVERLMSLLNHAYQNVAYSREFCSANMEKKLKKCTGMADNRSEEWFKSLRTMVEVLNERTTRVALKGKQFEAINPASDHNVVTTENSVIVKVDKTIVKRKYQAKDLSSC